MVLPERIDPGSLQESCADRLNFNRAVPYQFRKGRQFVVSPDVVVDCLRGLGRMDARPHGQACHRGLLSAEFLDGSRQRPEDRLGAAAAP